MWTGWGWGLPAECCKSFDQCPNLAHICDASGYCLQNGLSVQMLVLHHVGAAMNGRAKKSPQLGAFVKQVCLEGVLHAHHTSIAAEEAVGLAVVNSRPTCCFGVCAYSRQRGRPSVTEVFVQGQSIVSVVGNS